MTKKIKNNEPLVDLETGEVITNAIMHHYRRHHTKNDYTKPQGEINRLPSRTIPDATMSIADMLKRYANGLPINGSQRVPMYEGEDLLPDPKRMDIAEYHDLVNQTRKEINDIVEKQRVKKEAQIAAKMEQQFRIKWQQEQKDEVQKKGEQGESVPQKQ